jgi:hypothetical protein
MEREPRQRRRSEEISRALCSRRCFAREGNPAGNIVIATMRSDRVSVAL